MLRILSLAIGCGESSPSHRELEVPAAIEVWATALDSRDLASLVAYMPTDARAEAASGFTESKAVKFIVGRSRAAATLEDYQLSAVGPAEYLGSIQEGTRTYVIVRTASGELTYLTVVSPAEQGVVFDVPPSLAFPGGQPLVDPPMGEGHPAWDVWLKVQSALEEGNVERLSSFLDPDLAQELVTDLCSATPLAFSDEEALRRLLQTGKAARDASCAMEPRTLAATLWVNGYGAALARTSSGRTDRWLLGSVEDGDEVLLLQRTQVQMGISTSVFTDSVVMRRSGETWRLGIDRGGSVSRFRIAVSSREYPSPLGLGAADPTYSCRPWSRFSLEVHERGGRVFTVACESDLVGARTDGNLLYFVLNDQAGARMAEQLSETSEGSDGRISHGLKAHFLGFESRMVYVPEPLAVWVLGGFAPEDPPIELVRIAKSLNP
jgi:hypothetical protein